MSQPQEKYVEVNGTRLCYFERGTPSKERPTLLFVHATGFHARTWDYHCEALAEFHSIAIDQRGHGRSSKLAVDNWRTFGEDQQAFIEALDLRNLFGVGHSMGGHGLVQAAAGSSRRFAGLLLLDPTISEPDAYRAEAADAESGLHPAAKRRKFFASVDAMVESLGSKSSFPLFAPRIFNDYCKYGLEPAPDGRQLQLCCEPEIEAHVYMAARSNKGIYDSVRSLDRPVMIIRAQRPADMTVMDFSVSPTWPGLVREFNNAQELHWQDCTHFIPMQRPNEVVQAIRDNTAAV